MPSQRNSTVYLTDTHKSECLHRFGLTDLILCEVCRECRTRTARRVLSELSQFEMYNIGGEALAIAAARNL